MSQVRGRWSRGAAAVLGAALIAGCGANPAPPTPDPASSGADRRPGPPAAFEHVADDPILHGEAVFAPRLVALPGGAFLMRKNEDMPSGGVLLRSDDGRSWSQVDTSASGMDAGAIEDLAANGTAVVALGTTTPRDGSGLETPDLSEWTTVDGVTWTRVADADAVLRAIVARTIVASPRGFAALGDDPRAILMSGSDGRQWRRTEVPIAAGVKGGIGLVAPTGDGFVAIGTVAGRSTAWRWAGAGWFSLPLPDTDAISRIDAAGGRLIVSGTRETPDPANPDQSTVAAVWWESTDGGMSWGSTGLSLDGIADLRVFGMDGGFLAVLTPVDAQKPDSAWRSVTPGVWEPVTFTAGGGGADRPFVSALARSGSHVVLAGNTVGTGAGGDRVVVWVGETTAP